MANLSERLAEKVTARGVSVAYGDKVELDGAKLVPVALVTYGFGGGGDADDNGGGGGWGATIPIGAYVPSVDGPRFAPNIIALLAVSIPVVCVAGYAIARIVRATR